MGRVLCSTGVRPHGLGRAGPFFSGRATERCCAHRGRALTLAVPARQYSLCGGWDARRARTDLIRAGCGSELTIPVRLRGSRPADALRTRRKLRTYAAALRPRRRPVVCSRLGLSSLQHPRLDGIVALATHGRLRGGAVCAAGPFARRGRLCGGRLGRGRSTLSFSLLNCLFCARSVHSTLLVSALSGSPCPSNRRRARRPLPSFLRKPHLHCLALLSRGAGARVPRYRTSGKRPNCSTVRAPSPMRRSRSFASSLTHAAMVKYGREQHKHGRVHRTV